MSAVSGALGGAKEVVVAHPVTVACTCPEEVAPYQDTRIGFTGNIDKKYEECVQR